MMKKYYRMARPSRASADHNLRDNDPPSVASSPVLYSKPSLQTSSRIKGATCSYQNKSRSEEDDNNRGPCSKGVKCSLLDLQQFEV